MTLAVAFIRRLPNREDRSELVFASDSRLSGGQGLDPYRDAFVFSLSESDDLLSQWRAYGRAGNGYAVGFDVSSLLQIAQASSGYLSKCHYESGDDKRLIRIVIDDAVRKLHQLLATGSESLIAHRSRCLCGWLPTRSTNDQA